MITDELLEQTRVTPAFREALERFRATGRPNERVAFDARSPAVKVERTLTMALKEYPHLPLESIEVHGSSGCEYFSGIAVLRTDSAERHVEFLWDCKWRAEQMGWRDYFGFADQTRAAREFGWDCFRRWREVQPLPRRDGAVEDPEPDAVPA